MKKFADIKGNEKMEADVVVVGTGAGGASCAHRLAKAGKSVIMIEEGSFVPPEEYTTDSWSAMRQLYRDNGMRAMVGTMIIPTMQARVVGGTTVINSANVAIRGDNAFSRHFHKMVSEGADPSMAKRTVARKILETALSMLKNGTVYKEDFETINC